MGFWDKILEKIELSLVKIKPQLTENGPVFIGGKHEHGDKHIHIKVDEKTLQKLVSTPKIKERIINSTLADLKPEETKLISMSEDELDQKVFLSTIASTAEILQIKQPSDSIGISEHLDVAMGNDQSKFTDRGDIGETDSATIRIPKNRSKGPQDDSDETM